MCKHGIVDTQALQAYRLRALFQGIVLQLLEILFLVFDECLQPCALCDAHLQLLFENILLVWIFLSFQKLHQLFGRSQVVAVGYFKLFLVLVLLSKFHVLDDRIELDVKIIVVA